MNIENISFGASKKDDSVFQNYQKEINNCIRTALFKSDREKNIFESLILLFKTHFEKPAHSISEIKARNTKTKGDIFETFCYLYLQQKGYQVWFLKDLPEEYLQILHLDRKDYGIDLIARVQSGGNDFWFPVQCKYRKPTKNSLGQTVHRVGWKEISTFLALVSKTGPDKYGWKKHIIMTNADYVSWKGKKASKDWTIAKKTFEGLSRSFWKDMIGLKGYSLTEEKVKEDKEEKDPEEKDLEEKKEEVRNLRQKWLDNVFKK